MRSVAEAAVTRSFAAPDQSTVARPRRTSRPPAGQRRRAHPSAGRGVLRLRLADSARVDRRAAGGGCVEDDVRRLRRPLEGRPCCSEIHDRSALAGMGFHRLDPAQSGRPVSTVVCCTTGKRAVSRRRHAERRGRPLAVACPRAGAARGRVRERCRWCVRPGPRAEPSASAAVRSGGIDHGIGSARSRPARRSAAGGAGAPRRSRPRCRPCPARLGPPDPARPSRPSKTWRAMRARSRPTCSAERDIVPR